MSMILPSQAYELKLAPHPAPTSVLRFNGRDAVSELYRYDIEFTSPIHDIPMEKVVGRPAKFIISPVDPNMDYLRKMFGENAEQFSKMPAAYTIHGIVTEFDELSSSADQTHYRVRLEPKLADLNRGVTSRLFQKQSVEEIVTDTLRHYGYRAGVDFQFKLRGEYKRREYITQYHETTFAFIQRLCAEEGIWFRWEQKKDHAVVVFGDDLDAYARKQRTVSYRRDAGLESSGIDAIKTLEKRTKRVPEAVRLHDYNHRQAGVSLLVEQSAARDDKTTSGIDYRWGEHYETPDEGQRVAQLRHEEFLSAQISFRGTGNPFWLEAGEVMRLDANPSDAQHGIFITAVESQGGRGQSYWVSFEGIPSDRIWRTSVRSIVRPVIDGMLPARITSPGDYKYAYLNEQGWYVIKLPFDLDEWSPGGSSRPVRFAKPYSGDNYGHHFPLIDGAEVAIIHTAGDPNRPVIIGAMHDSLHPDLVTSRNNTRNILRTAAQNELRMEDKEGVEHIHLTTPFQTSELNLGHLVDEERKERGRGAELRTDGPVAVRGSGVLITAEIQRAAEGKQLAMDQGVSQLQSAYQLTKSLTSATNAAGANTMDIAEQQSTNAELKNLAAPAVFVTAPAAIGFATNSGIQMAARNSIIATAGKDMSVSILRRFTATVGESISLFAQKCGIKLFANSGPVEIQAQNDVMSLLSKRDMTISSADGVTKIQSKQAVVLESGGAFIRIADGNVMIGGPGDLILKMITLQKQGAASLSDSITSPAGPTALYDEQFTLVDKHSGEIMPHTPYRIQSASGETIEGVSDELGRTVRASSGEAESIKIFKGDLDE